MKLKLKSNMILKFLIFNLKISNKTYILIIYKNMFINSIYNWQQKKIIKNKFNTFFNYNF